MMVTMTETLPDEPMPEDAFGIVPRELVGVVDIARRLKVPRTTVSMWNSRRATTGMPAPVGEPAMGPIFDWHDVAKWYFEEFEPRKFR